MRDERLRELMEQIGLPNSSALYTALKQLANEVEIETLKKYGIDCWVNNFIHKKTGNVYELVSKGIVNATNGFEGQVMTMYMRRKKIFVREENEFNDKFENLSSVLLSEEI